MRNFESRKKTFRTAVLSLAVLALVGLAASPALADAYAAEYLAPFAIPASMNDRGTIVGWDPVFRTAFVYDDLLGYVELPCFKGFVCRALDVNERGTVAGYATTTALVTRERAVFWELTGSLYRISAIPFLSGTTTTSTRAIAIDGSDRILGLAWYPRGPMVRITSFLWSKSGSAVLDVPGPAVDLNDAGQVVGNATLPYIYDSVTGKLTYSSLSPGWTSAHVHAVSPAGAMAGSVENESGFRNAARADRDGVWMALGGGGSGDYAFGINETGDVAGHVHGLVAGSHCGLRFIEDVETVPLESRSFPETNLWVAGEVAGMNSDRLLAAEAVHATSGLPGLIRLKLGSAPWRCDGCLTATVQIVPLPVEPSSPIPWYQAVVAVQGVDGVEVKVQLVWMAADGRVVRDTRPTGKDGIARFAFSAAGRVEAFVTRLDAPGVGFDPTRGTLHAVAGEAR